LSKKSSVLKTLATISGYSQKCARAKVAGDITLEAGSTTGGLDFAIDIQGDVGAICRATAGNVDDVRPHLVGFEISYLDYPPAILQSDNYPAGNNFDVTLTVATGRIDINADYTP
jgi:hypothetical protein